MMKVIGTVLTACVLMQSTTPSFRTEWGVVLPSDSWRGFYKMCSRPAPALRGYWVPDSETIRTLEPALAAALEEALAREDPDGSWRPATRDYYRQYIGLHAGRRRIVYVNGFHYQHLELSANARPKSASRWRTRLVNVCDGGSWYFGAEYDPATRQVRNVHFNGNGMPASSSMHATRDE